MSDRILRFLGKSYSWPLWQRLAFAIAVVLLAAGIRILLSVELGLRLLYVTFYPAVAVAAIVGGFSGGVVATALAIVFAHVFFAPLLEVADLVGLSAFTVSCAIIVALAALVQLARARLLASETANRSAQLLGQFVEQAPVALAMFDKNMRYIAASGRWKNDYNLAEDFIGRSHYEVFPEIGDEWRSVHRRALAGETVSADEDRFIRANGMEQWLRWEVRPWRTDAGDIGGVSIFSEDITGRKAIEQQFATAQRLETVGRLAGGVAHDFNNLLAVIAGNLELLAQRVKDDAMMSLIRPALEAAEAGAIFNRRLLSLAGTHRVDARPLAINERIEDVRVLFERLIEAEIALKYDLASDLWSSIADAGELDSALLNLVTNSRDAMPRGGEIVIQTRNVTIDPATATKTPGAQPGDYVRISVADNGEGMSKVVIEHALEPFFTTKEQGKGTGLGLRVGLKTT